MKLVKKRYKIQLKVPIYLELEAPEKENRNGEAAEKAVGDIYEKLREHCGYQGGGSHSVRRLD